MLYCIVLYYIVLYCIVLYCIVLYCIVLYCIVLYCIVLYCIVLYCIVLYCIVDLTVLRQIKTSYSKCCIIVWLWASLIWLQYLNDNNQGMSFNIGYERANHNYFDPINQLITISIISISHTNCSDIKKY